MYSPLVDDILSARTNIYQEVTQTKVSSIIVSAAEDAHDVSYLILSSASISKSRKWRMRMECYSSDPAIPVDNCIYPCTLLDPLAVVNVRLYTWPNTS